MSFRLELGHGNGKPLYWEVHCGYCEVVGSFSVEQFPDFPDAFNRASAVGWGLAKTARGTRDLCPQCNKGEDDE